jgi:hypothetical protein
MIEMVGAGGAAAAGAITPAGWLMAGSQVLSAALSPSNAGPSSATQLLDQTFDFGGWTVATGGSSAEGSTAGLELPPWMILAAVVVVALAWKTKKN